MHAVHAFVFVLHVTLCDCMSLCDNNWQCMSSHFNNIYR